MYTLAMGALVGTTLSLVAIDATLLLLLLLLLLKPMVEYKASRKEPLTSTLGESNTAARIEFDVNRMIVGYVYKQR